MYVFKFHFILLENYLCYYAYKNSKKYLLSLIKCTKTGHGKFKAFKLPLRS